MGEGEGSGQGEGQGSGWGWGSNVRLDHLELLRRGPVMPAAQLVRQQLELLMLHLAVRVGLLRRLQALLEAPLLLFEVGQGFLAHLGVEGVVLVHLCLDFLHFSCAPRLPLLLRVRVRARVRVRVRVRVGPLAW